MNRDEKAYCDYLARIVFEVKEENKRVLERMDQVEAWVKTIMSKKRVTVTEEWDVQP
jgi:hypothetical protein